MKPKKKRATAQPQPAPRQRADQAPTQHLLAGLALCAITLLAFSNSFQSGFVLDNKGLLLQDPRIREATRQNLESIFQHTYWWPNGETGLYRPLTTLSYLLNYALLGNRDQPAGYHWINLVLHVGNVLLVYALMLRLLRKFWPSVFVAALWAVHPLLTESVTNIIGRADLIAAMALLSGFLMYLNSAETKGFPRISWLAGLMTVTAAGVFSKESAVAVLGVMVLYELIWRNERKSGRPLLWGCLAVLVPVGAMLYERAVVLAASLPALFPYVDNPIVGAGFWTGRLTAIKVIARYLWLAAWPANLSCDYSYPQISLANGGAEDWLSWIVVAAAVVGALLLCRRNRAAFFLACFAFLNFVPVSNLFFPIGAIMAERFLYLPLAGLLGCLVLAIYVVAERIRVAAFAPLLLCIIGVGFAGRTWSRNLDWQNDLTMATAAVRSGPNSFKTHKLLAGVLYESDPDHSNIDKVIGEADKSIALLDSLPNARNQADAYLWPGAYYLVKGDRLSQRGANGEMLSSPASVAQYDRARELLLRSIAIDRSARAEYHRQHDRGLGNSTALAAPNGDIETFRTPAEAQRLLSEVYLRLGDPDNALTAGALSSRLDPLNPEVYRQMAAVFLAERRADDAAAKLMAGLLITSDPGLREELLNVYRSGLDVEGCAIVPGPRGPAINPHCEMIHRHICTASTETVKARLQTGRRDLAKTQRSTFVRDYDCPAGPMDALLQAGL